MPQPQHVYSTGISRRIRKVAIYHRGKIPRSRTRLIAKIVLVLAILLVGATVIAVQVFQTALRPVSADQFPQEITIRSGTTVQQMSNLLEKQGVIRHAWAFQRYVQLKKAGGYLQAGTYQFSPSQSTQQIVSQLTHGKVATKLVTILPGQRLDQIKRSLINQGFTEEEVAAAFEPSQYKSLAIMADLPTGASLEGYLYPDSYQRTNSTTASDIVSAALTEMSRHLTPDILLGMKTQGLTTYQGVIIASIVEKEAVTQSDRQQAAQVFIKRLGAGMSLGSDVTAFYGSELAGIGQDVNYDTPYNTRIHTGFPPTPISNVSAVSLDAVAHPAKTDWLFFVAGDDGTTHFSRTAQEHEALVKQYCKILCQ